MKNSILLGFSSTAVAVFGICGRIQGIVTVGVHGIDNGLIPIMAYNYGARKHDRMKDAIRWTLIYSVLLYLVFFLLLEAAPSSVLKIFDASENMISIGIPALRILAVAYLISIPNMVIAAALQGLSLGTRSMYLTMSRQAVLPVALAMLLQGFGNLKLIWACFILAETICIPFAIFLWKRSIGEVTAG